MTPLQKAAQAAIRHWDKGIDPTEAMSELRVALEADAQEVTKLQQQLDTAIQHEITLSNTLDKLKAQQAQAVEPIGYIRHADKTFWPHPECAVYASVSPSLAPVYAHPAPPVEQAQSQPVATVQCVRGVTIGYLDVMQPVGTKLYTHPAQQVAVPMTEAQIFACDPVPHVMFDQQRIDFARAVEAFHGIGVKPVTKPDSRPQNCGTGHCSCIECPYPKADWSAA